MEEHHDGGFHIGHPIQLCISLENVGPHLSLSFILINHKNIQPCTLGPCSTSWFSKLLLVLQIIFMSHLKLDIISRNKIFETDFIFFENISHPSFASHAPITKPQIIFRAVHYVGFGL